MKHTLRSVLFIAIGSLISMAAYSQGSGSTQSAGTSQSRSFGSASPDRERSASFEVIRTVKGTLVKSEKGQLFLKTKKGKIFNLRFTAETLITSKKKDKVLENGQLLKVAYKPKKSKKDEPEAVRVKILE